MQMNFLNGREVKDIYYDDDARDKLISGITKLARAVKSTLGARGRTVLIESKEHIGGVTVTKDGVTVASAINVKDPTEDLAIRLMKEAAHNTASEAGDGTTTSIVLAEALIRSATDLFSVDSGDITEVLRELRNVCEDVVVSLEKMSKRLTKETIMDVATISANSDATLGALIGDTYNSVGKYGVVTVEDSESSLTYSDIVSGIKLERGWTSPLFVTDHNTQEAVMDSEPYILITDHEIPSVDSIENILKPIIGGKQELLIIGNLEPRFLSTLNSNIARQGGDIKIKNIIPPQFGWKMHKLMEDIAIATGGKYICSHHGDDLQLVGMDHLGRAGKIIIGQSRTLIFPMEGMREGIGGHIESLWSEHDGLRIKDSIMERDEKSFIKERIATLSGNIGIIKVGAQSEIELKEKRDRVDDAVCATRAAMEDGILPGGGVALYVLGSGGLDGRRKNPMKSSRDIALSIMGSALCSPYYQILENAGMDGTSLEVPSGGCGWDVKSGTYVDMYGAGIIDPTKVTVCALRNAVSVATTILSTNAIITNQS